MVLDDVVLVVCPAVVLCPCTVYIYIGLPAAHISRLPSSPNSNHTERSTFPVSASVRACVCDMAMVDAAAVSSV